MSSCIMWIVPYSTCANSGPGTRGEGGSSVSMEGGGGQSKGSVSPGGCGTQRHKTQRATNCNTIDRPLPSQPNENLNEQGTNRRLPNKAICVRVYPSINHKSENSTALQGYPKKPLLFCRDSAPGPVHMLSYGVVRRLTVRNGKNLFRL